MAGRSVAKGAAGPRLGSRCRGCTRPSRGSPFRFPAGVRTALDSGLTPDRRLRPRRRLRNLEKEVTGQLKAAPHLVVVPVGPPSGRTSRPSPEVSHVAKDSHRGACRARLCPYFMRRRRWQSGHADGSERSNDRISPGQSGHNWRATRRRSLSGVSRWGYTPGNRRRSIGHVRRP